VFFKFIDADSLGKLPFNKNDNETSFAVPIYPLYHEGSFLDSSPRSIDPETDYSAEELWCHHLNENQTAKAAQLIEGIYPWINRGKGSAEGKGGVW
jgi:hypothetical protein